MILSCDYCFAIFDQNYWSWCVFKNINDDSKTILCSLCAWEIVRNQKISEIEE